MNGNNNINLQNRIDELEQEKLGIEKLLKEAKSTLKQYEEATLKAKNASKMKSLFLANMSHEIRTPLNAIEGFSRIMAETDSQEERTQFLEIIESNNMRLHSLINDILDMSRVESGEISFKIAETNINQMFKSIKQMFKFKCPNGVTLDYRCSESSLIFKTDKNRLEQVFSNLINNAIKHTKAGTIMFGYNLSEDKKYIEFYVSDTGSGIEEEELRRIFKTYYSKDAETNNGCGLGLPLSKIIVERLGGKIKVVSKKGRGSKFSFMFHFGETIKKPSKRPSDNTLRKSRTLRVNSILDEKEKKLILIAEDEESNYELLNRALKSRYRIIRATDGIQAVTLNEDENPDLILMDIKMPNMNGLDATRIIKEVNHNKPIIALSAYAFPENIQDAKMAGCNDFISKPINIDELIVTIGNFLNEEK